MNRRQFITALSAALGATVIPGVDEASSWHMAFNSNEPILLSHLFFPGNYPMAIVEFDPNLLIQRQQNWIVLVDGDCFRWSIGGRFYLSIQIANKVTRIGARYLKDNGLSWYPIYRIVDVV